MEVLFAADMEELAGTLLLVFSLQKKVERESSAHTLFGSHSPPRMRTAIDSERWRGKGSAIWRAFTGYGVRTLSFSPIRLVFIGVVFVLFSWYLLALKSRLFLKEYNAPMILFIELISIVLDLIGCGCLFLMLLTGEAAPQKRERASARELLERHSSTAAHHPAEVTRMWLRMALMCWAVLLIFIHWVVHHYIPREHRQSQEIVLLLARVGCDGAIMVIAVGYMCQQVWLRLENWVENRGSLREKHYMNVVLNAAWYIVLLVVFCVLLRIWGSSMGTATLPHLRVSILGEPIDPCQAEGMELNSAVSASWVLPAIHPRRLYNFYSGAEVCRTSSWHSIAYVDRAFDTLVISGRCADGVKPRVYIDRPDRSEFSGESDVMLPEVSYGNRAYHDRLEELYGTVPPPYLTVHRDPESKRIASVEWKQNELKLVKREPRNDEEKRVRKWWPSPKSVIEVPLGMSAAYSVLCGTSDEEYFVYPMKRAPAWDGPIRTTTTGNASSPIGPVSNVLVIMLDAVSRQGVVRRLPKFTNWARDFQKKQEKKSAEDESRVLVRELRHSTLGFSTAGNVVPTLTGDSLSSYLAKGIAKKDVAFMHRTLFNIAKETHGDGISTSFAVDYCSAVTEYLFMGQNATSGRGERYEGIDYYLYQPFCHLDYSGRLSNFKGPYSILQRCIDHRFVHEHMIDYVESLLQRQLLDQNASPDTRFFDFNIFIEGHEGTHSAIGLVDDALVGLMQRLESELGFFDDPKNTLIFMADHGNHMGPYFEFFEAGQFERTTPGMLFFIHQDTLNRVDDAKNRKEGTALTNFNVRTKHISTPLDMYATLADLLSLPIDFPEVYRDAKVKPTSLFDERDLEKNVACGDLNNGGETAKCALDFCVPRNSTG